MNLDIWSSSRKFLDSQFFNSVKSSLSFFVIQCADLNMLGVNKEEKGRERLREWVGRKKDGKFFIFLIFLYTKHNFLVKNNDGLDRYTYKRFHSLLPIVKSQKRCKIIHFKILGKGGVIWKSDDAVTNSCTNLYCTNWCGINSLV